MGTDLALVRLLQLVSPGLPIGMYSYSQGLERAVDDGWVSTAEAAREWIGGILHTSITRVDVPILLRLIEAWRYEDPTQVSHWSQTLTAWRETAELRAEDRQTGQALAKLLVTLDVAAAAVWQRHPQATLATAYSLAAVRWDIDPRPAAIGYVWSWLENQVLCAVKLVPLGQVAGQQLLQALAAQIPAQVDCAALIADDDIGGSAFGLALASSRHEGQYSRLFRS
ncbi:MAG: urease accessory UreF family protein [Methylovulum sp.]|nr:urease accessory UreF family protein [Methylovulum sp.]